MLKRIFIMLAVALAFTIPSQAISIQELKSSPQFKEIYEVTPDGPNADEHTTWYLRYFGLHPRMKEMLEYILQHDFSQQEAGRIILDADDLFINLDEVELKRKEAQRLEFHKNYIDIQVPLVQDETMGWTALSDLDEPDIAYNPERDCGFYTQGAKEYFRVKPGQFTIFFPEDAHAPIIGNGKQRKLVGKIRV